MSLATSTDDYWRSAEYGQNSEVFLERLLQQNFKSQAISTMNALCPISRCAPIRPSPSYRHGLLFDGVTIDRRASTRASVPGGGVADSW